MNGASPESTAPGASTRSWKFGRVAHGAPVCFACESSVGSHGQVEHEHRDADVEEVAQPLALEERRRDRQADAEEERPVVHVDHQREHHREHGQPAAPAVDDRLQPRERGDQAEERLHAVHPRLLRVVREVRVEGGERGAVPAGDAVERGAADPVGKRDAADREDHREDVGRLTPSPKARIQRPSSM